MNVQYPPIIGVAGHAQHGKNTIGDILAVYHDYQRAAFADKVRELALAIDPWVSIDGIGWWLSDLVETDGWDATKKITKVRGFLQDIGEGARQFLGSDVWIDALFRQIDSKQANYVITDVRYQNEVDAIHARGGVVWRVLRPGFDNGVGVAHPSESGIGALPVDDEIMNDGTVDDLAAKIESLMHRPENGN